MILLEVVEPLFAKIEGSMNPTLIYHITHFNNLRSILSNGGLRCYEEIAKMKHHPVNIAHPSIQDRRSRASVPCGPQGNLHEYVPFYFAPRSPMLYTIHKGNVEHYKGGQESIIHIVSSVEKVEETGHEFVFTDGHAIMTFTLFYDDAANLEHIDWEIMGAKYWNDTPQDPDRKRRRQSEFLIYNKLDWSAVIGIGVYSKEMRKEIERILSEEGQSCPVRVRRGWYY
jgi:hypothetical protein